MVLGESIDKGVVIVGPSGTGSTMTLKDLINHMVKPKERDVAEIGLVVDENNAVVVIKDVDQEIMDKIQSVQNSIIKADVSLLQEELPVNPDMIKGFKKDFKPFRLDNNPKGKGKLFYGRQANHFNSMGKMKNHGKHGKR